MNDGLAVPLGLLAVASLLLVPLTVGRWWVGLLIMQVNGAAVRLDDGTGPAINYRTIFFLIVVGLVVLLLLGLRLLFDNRRPSRADAPRE